VEGGVEGFLKAGVLKDFWEDGDGGLIGFWDGWRSEGGGEKGCIKASICITRTDVYILLLII